LTQKINVIIYKSLTILKSHHLTAKGKKMRANVSVIVRKGDINKALRALERKLRNNGLWEYDPDKRAYSGGKKVKKRSRRKAP